MSVKNKKRGRPSGKVSQLNAKKILESAKGLLREQGKIPSIRRLATHLDVDAMAIYHYFNNKNALLEAICVSLIEDIYEPSTHTNSDSTGDANKGRDEKDKWESELIKLSFSYLELLHDHPGLLETLLAMTSDGPSTVFSKRFNQIIAPLKLSSQDARNALHLLVDYLHGYALALNCNNTIEPLTMDFLNGPMKMYCRALHTTDGQQTA